MGKLKNYGKLVPSDKIVPVKNRAEAIGKLFYSNIVSQSIVNPVIILHLP